MATQGVSYNPGPSWPIVPAEIPRQAIAIPDYLLIQTHPKKEHTVLARLIHAGLDSYLPVLTRRRDGIRGDYAPFFPSYLFSRIPQALISDANSIMSLGGAQAGIGRVVCFGGWPATVGSAIIEEIQTRHNVSGFIDLEAEQERMEREEIEKLQAGDEVATNSGPFSGIKAIFQCHRGGDRVVLLYQMLGGQRSVELPAHQMVKV